jgi:hypothetical protein
MSKFRIIACFLFLFTLSACSQQIHHPAGTKRKKKCDCSRWAKNYSSSPALAGQFATQKSGNIYLCRAIETQKTLKANG